MGILQLNCYQNFGKRDTLINSMKGLVNKFPKRALKVDFCQKVQCPWKNRAENLSNLLAVLGGKFKLWPVLFSSHFGNLVFGKQYYVIVCLFFILFRPFCLANGKHHTESHATKATKKLKTKLPKYVMSWGLEFVFE